VPFLDALVPPPSEDDSIKLPLYSPPPPSAEPCQGYCGGQSASLCWCDDECTNAGDCCFDASVTCGLLPTQLPDTVGVCENGLKLAADTWPGLPFEFSSCATVSSATELVNATGDASVNVVILVGDVSVFATLGIDRHMVFLGDPGLCSAEDLDGKCTLRAEKGFTGPGFELIKAELQVYFHGLRLEAFDCDEGCVFHSSFTMSVHLDQTDVVNNYASVSGGAARSQAGDIHLYVSSGSKVVGNSAGVEGGVVSSAKGSIFIAASASEFTANGAKRGAIAAVDVAQELHINATASTFSSNVANRGGVAYCQAGHASLLLDESSAVVDNVANYAGGVVFMLSGTVNMSIRGGSAVLGNHAKLLGGVVSLAFGELDVLLDNGTVENNTAAWGGVMQVEGAACDVGVVQSTVRSNSASYGGVLYSNFGASQLSLHDSEVSSNLATESGGVAMSGNAVMSVLASGQTVIEGNHANLGAVMASNNGELFLTLVNGTSVASNSATSGGVTYSSARDTNIDMRQFASMDNNSASNGGVAYAGSGDVVVHMHDDAAARQNVASQNGGLVYGEEGVVLLHCQNRSRLEANAASFEGGAMFSRHGGVRLLAIDESEICANTAVRGGVAGSETGMIEVELQANARVHGNHADQLGGAWFTTYKGMVITCSGNSTMEDNTAGSLTMEGDGGAAYSVDGDVSIYTSGQARFAHNRAIGGQHAGHGGVVYVNHGQVTIVSIDESSFESNSASVAGGVAYVQSGSALLDLYDESVYRNNSAGLAGGVLYAQNHDTHDTIVSAHISGASVSENRAAVGAFVFAGFGQSLSLIAENATFVIADDTLFQDPSAFPVNSSSVDAAQQALLSTHGRLAWQGDGDLNCASNRLALLGCTIVLVEDAAVPTDKVETQFLFSYFAPAAIALIGNDVTLSDAGSHLQAVAVPVDAAPYCVTDVTAVAVSFLPPSSDAAFPGAQEPSADASCSLACTSASSETYVSLPADWSCLFRDCDSVVQLKRLSSSSVEARFAYAVDGASPPLSLTALQGAGATLSPEYAFVEASDDGLCSISYSNATLPPASSSDPAANVFYLECNFEDLTAPEPNPNCAEDVQDCVWMGYDEQCGVVANQHNCSKTQTNLEFLRFHWQPFVDPESTQLSYEYKVGTTQGDGDVLGLSDPITDCPSGNATCSFSWQLSEVFLSLTPSVRLENGTLLVSKYFVSIRALNSIGLATPWYPALAPSTIYEDCGFDRYLDVDLECVSCPANMYTKGTGNLFAEPAAVPPVLQASGTQATSVQSPEMQDLNPTRISESCLCISGFFRLPEVFPLAEGCQECPEGGICTGDDAYPEPDEGWWADMVPTVVPKFHECEEVGSLCIGGWDGETDSGTCGESYAGRMCAECKHNYGRYGSFCTSCSVAGKVLTILAIPLVVALWVVLTALSGVSAGLDIALAYFAETSLLLNVDVEWPDVLTWIFYVNSVLAFNADVITPGCLFDWSLVASFFLQAAMPFAMLVILAFVYFVPWPCTKRSSDSLHTDGNEQVRSGSDGSPSASSSFNTFKASWSRRLRNLRLWKVERGTSNSHARSNGDAGRAASGDAVGSKQSQALQRYITTAGSAMNLLLVGTSEAALMPWGCRSTTSGEQFVSNFPEVSCYSALHVGMLATSVVLLAMVAVYIGLLVYVIRIAFRDDSAASRRLRHKYEWVWDRYVPKHYYWEVKVAVEKVGLSAITIAITDAEWQILVGTAWLGIHGLLQAYFKPYRSDLDRYVPFNILETVIGAAQVFQIYSAYVFDVGSSTDSVKGFVTVTVILLTAVMLVLSVYSAVVDSFIQFRFKPGNRRKIRRLVGCFLLQRSHQIKARTLQLQALEMAIAAENGDDDGLDANAVSPAAERPVPPFPPTPESGAFSPPSHPVTPGPWENDESSLWMNIKGDVPVGALSTRTALEKSSRSAQTNSDFAVVVSGVDKEVSIPTIVDAIEPVTLHLWLSHVLGRNFGKDTGERYKPDDALVHVAAFLFAFGWGTTHQAPHCYYYMSKPHLNVAHMLAQSHPRLVEFLCEAESDVVEGFNKFIRSFQEWMFCEDASGDRAPERDDEEKQLRQGDPEVVPRDEISEEREPAHGPMARRPTRLRKPVKKIISPEYLPNILWFLLDEEVSAHQRRCVGQLLHNLMQVSKVGLASCGRAPVPDRLPLASTAALGSPPQSQASTVQQPSRAANAPESQRSVARRRTLHYVNTLQASGVYPAPVPESPPNPQGERLDDDCAWDSVGDNAPESPTSMYSTTSTIADNDKI